MHDRLAFEATEEREVRLQHMCDKPAFKTTKDGEARLYSTEALSIICHPRMSRRWRPGYSKYMVDWYLKQEERKARLQQMSVHWLED